MSEGEEEEAGGDVEGKEQNRVWQTVIMCTFFSMLIDRKLLCGGRFSVKAK